MTAQFLHAVNRRCPICREFHDAPNEAAFVRKVDACRDAFIRFAIQREYIQTSEMHPDMDAQADTVAR